jgi:secondary thiamine-phosphate synthase enzyme
VIAKTDTIRRATDGNDHIIDLTDEVQGLVSDAGVITGQAVVMVVGSTAAISTLEYEPGLVNRDIAAAYERIAPRHATYVHEETWHDDNGHSHVRATITGPSAAFPIVDGRIPLGTWQQIVLIDFDTRARKREVVVSIIGT